MSSTFRVYPAFGVARVGDSEGSGFIGPEMPGVPANWNFSTGSFDKFKDDQHRIKRQGVRFRVFEFDDRGVLIGEALAGRGSVAAVEWTVHVANRKASFFCFDGPKGEDGDFSGNRLRNENIPEAERVTLDMDPGPKSVVGISTGPVALTNPNPKTNTIIQSLGDISTDSEGRLLSFFGRGKTVQLGGDIKNYVNNDGWFDDVCDGPVSAVVVLQDGSRVDALGAWVSVGPPDFAPAIANVVSLYETMWDVAVRHPDLPIPDLVMFRVGGAFERLQQQRNDWDATTNRFKSYQPSYVNDIASLLNRAFSATFVHAPRDVGAFHNTIAPQMWKDLGNPDPVNTFMREVVFARMRDPSATVGANSALMPRGLGDEYCDESEAPQGSKERDNSKRFFSLTPTQYAMLAQWKDNKFVPDGDAPMPIPASAGPITPEGLDRAALENCVGGPFFPGIEVSWIVRNPRIYAEPFRVRSGVKIAERFETGPGFFTQQMALPWHADFRDCKREPLTNTSTGTITYAMWWAGQRPDDVFPESDPNSQVPWTRAPHFNATDDDPVRFKEMVAGWSTLGFVARRSDDRKRWLETERA